MGSFEDALACSMEVKNPDRNVQNFGLLTSWRHVSSLGALITVLALAVGPFVQQATSYQLEQVASSQNSTLPVRLTFVEGLSATFKTAAYNGLFGSGTSTLTPDCPSGNCSWVPYQSLAVCSKCVNVTGLVKYWVSGTEVSTCGISLGNSYFLCQWTLPNGLALGNKFKAAEASSINISGTLPPMMLDKVGYAIVSFSLLTIGDRLGPLATECSLYWCINTYTATANNTIFTETFHNSWYNATSTLPLANRPSNVYDPDTTEIYNITPPTGSAQLQPKVNLSRQFNFLSQEYYLVGAKPVFGEWLGSLLSGSMIPDATPPYFSDVVELFLHENRQVPEIFTRLAQNLTVAIRTAAAFQVIGPGMGKALGVTWLSKTIVRVRWAWLSFPCALLVASLVFLVITVVGTARGELGIWKSSTLALLFHGLGERGGERVEGSGHVVGMEETARRMKVRFVDEGKGGGWLVER